MLGTRARPVIGTDLTGTATGIANLVGIGNTRARGVWFYLAGEAGSTRWFTATGPTVHGLAASLTGFHWTASPGTDHRFALRLAATLPLLALALVQGLAFSPPVPALTPAAAILGRAGLGVVPPKHTCQKRQGCQQSEQAASRIGSREHARQSIDVARVHGATLSALNEHSGARHFLAPENTFTACGSG
jgi:hypothetical protein